MFVSQFFQYFDKKELMFRFSEWMDGRGFSYVRVICVYQVTMLFVLCMSLNVFDLRQFLRIGWPETELVSIINLRTSLIHV